MQDSYPGSSAQLLFILQLYGGVVLQKLGVEPHSACIQIYLAKEAESIYIVSMQCDGETTAIIVLPT